MHAVKWYYEIANQRAEARKFCMVSSATEAGEAPCNLGFCSAFALVQTSILGGNMIQSCIDKWMNLCSLWIIERRLEITVIVSSGTEALKAPYTPWRNNDFATCTHPEKWWRTAFLGCGFVEWWLSCICRGAGCIPIKWWHYSAAFAPE